MRIAETKWVQERPAACPKCGAPAVAERLVGIEGDLRDLAMAVEVKGDAVAKSLAAIEDHLGELVTRTSSIAGHLADIAFPNGGE